MAAPLKTSKTFRLNSIFIKCAFMATLAILLVVGVMDRVSSKNTESQAIEALAKRASDVNGLLATQLGGSIKFGNQQAVKEILDNVIAAAAPDVLGGHVISSKSVELYHAEGFELNDEVIGTLAQQVLETGEEVISEDGLIIASPAMFGEGNAIAGVVVTQWTAQHKLTALGATRMETFLYSGIVFLISLAGLVSFLWLSMSRPLVRIEAAVAEVERGNYDVTIPFANRGDEIGGIATRLDHFRAALSDAQGAQRESAFRGSAFEGSTAPMMMVDETFTVIFMNPACTRLIEQLGAPLNALWPIEGAASRIGRDISGMKGLSKVIAGAKDDASTALPTTVNLSVGSRYVSVSISAAIGEDGEMIGAVMEWSDNTTAQRDSAVLQTIDKKQVRLEFSVEGRCELANENATRSLNISLDGGLGPQFSELFTSNQADTKIPQDLRSAALSGAEVYGKFMIKVAGSDEVKTFDGSFGPIMAPDGKLERAIFLGHRCHRSEP